MNASSSSSSYKKCKLADKRLVEPVVNIFLLLLFDKPPLEEFHIPVPPEPKYINQFIDIDPCTRAHAATSRRKT